MRNRPDYTTRALHYTGKFPTLTYVGIQTNFWIAANILLVIVLYLQSKVISQAYQLPVAGRFGPMVVIAIVLGLIYGISLGLAGYYLDRKIFKKLSLGKVIVFKGFGSIAVLSVILWLLRFVFFDRIISPSLNMTGVTLDDQSWRYLFYLLLIYYFFMTMVINLINQLNDKYGPGVVIPLLLGKYRNPREEERIFMFMDLKSSTSIAEKLGHLKYSALIRDCFMDINDVLLPFQAQVYQYVGDEIVLTWPEREGLHNNICINFYFACKKQIRERQTYYNDNYGILPEFKAGVHSGMVTAVEIGEIKKDIAYHGDTLNTAARIQSVCNEYKKSLLVSEDLFRKITKYEGVKTEALGMIPLRGKSSMVGIVSVDSIE
jgi:adenylate cyclase